MSLFEFYKLATQDELRGLFIHMEPQSSVSVVASRCHREGYQDRWLIDGLVKEECTLSSACILF